MNEIFSGSSRYANDFQSLITRAMSIASLPLSQLERGKTELESESSALAALQTRFSALAAAIDTLEDAIGADAYGVSVTGGAVLSAAISGAAEGVYNVEVTGLGAHTTTMSKDGFTTVTDPAAANIRAATSYTLTVNGTPTLITIAAPTLNALIEAINGSGAGVAATAVNVGTASSPDYRLSIRSDGYESLAISLADGATELLNDPVDGANASYKVNGATVLSDTRTVTIAPGLTATFLKTSETGVAETITVSRSTQAAENALNAFVNAYNQAVSELDKHRGDAGGALAGDAVLLTLSRALRDLMHYDSGSGGIASLTDLGLEFDDQGVLSLDAAKFDDASFAALASFLGSAAGSGFLETAAGVLRSVADETGGAIAAARDSVDASIDAQETAIEHEQESLDLYEAQITEKMNDADALIAALEQQAAYINGLFESMRVAAEMYGA